MKISSATCDGVPIVLIYGFEGRGKTTLARKFPKPVAMLLKLHKRARHLILDACDVVGFLAEELRVATDDGGFRERVRASSSNQRFLFVEGTPAYVAKNRYGMPPKIPVPADFDISELTKFWSQPKEGKGE